MGNQLSVIAETLLEFFACEEDSALYCAKGKLHLLSDLVVFVTCNVHRERYAQLVGEVIDGIGDFLCCV